ncbi:taste receptor type 2 member 140-like [Heterocephalus glaber]|uniref:Taste receptor type 2 member 140-like n=1 Tax=Heterocephalus glaber TaxID=10181 RepID=A0AAX6SZ62_HETGA|nr:taste receptor type 2 member 140-like [Heterocephalus glaber]
MGGIVQRIFTAIPFVEFILGNLENGFMVLVNSMDCVKRRKIPSVDKVLTALAISRITFLWSILLLIDTYIGVLNDAYKVNMSWRSNLSIYAGFPKHFRLSYIISFLIPFIISRTTFLLLIFSLWKHCMKVQHSHKGSRDREVWETEFVGKTLFHLLTQAAEIAFPSCHPFVLILGNTKLRQTFLLMLRWLRCRYADVESTGPQTI